MSGVNRWRTLGSFSLFPLGCWVWVKWVDPYPSQGGLAVLSIFLGIGVGGLVHQLLRRHRSRWSGYVALLVFLVLLFWSPLPWPVQGHPTSVAGLFLRRDSEEGFAAYYWKPTDMTFRMPARDWRPFDEMEGVLAFCYKDEMVPALIFRNDPFNSDATSSWKEYSEFWTKTLSEQFGDRKGVEVRDIQINQAAGTQWRRSMQKNVLQFYCFQLGANGCGYLSGGWDKDGADERAKAVQEGMSCFASTVSSRRRE